MKFVKTGATMGDDLRETELEIARIRLERERMALQEDIEKRNRKTAVAQAARTISEVSKQAGRSTVKATGEILKFCLAFAFVVVVSGLIGFAVCALYVLIIPSKYPWDFAGQLGGFMGLGGWMVVVGFIAAGIWAVLFQEKWWGWFAVITAVVCWLNFDQVRQLLPSYIPPPINSQQQDKGSASPEVPSGTAIQPPPPSASIAAPSPAVAASPQKSAYEVTLSELKATYPQIDPASPKFDPQILAVATRSLADLTSRGMPRDEALRQSVGLAVSLNPVRSAARQPEIMTRLVDGHRLLSANSPPEVCVYKPVMSDAEYRACGAKPP
jgi:hypothetical protein